MSGAGGGLALNYAPPKTIRSMMLDSTSLARFIVGPIGSGKSTGGIWEIMRRAMAQKPNAQGVRPTRFAIVRNTLQQLKTTFLTDVQGIFGSLADWRVSASTIYFNFPLADGTMVKSEWLLIPLETVEDIRRLLSTQLTGALVEEFREVDFKVIPSLLGRLGRYPSELLGGVLPSWQGLIGVSNPYPNGSEWNKVLEGDCPQGWRLWRQPSGLSSEAENRENLPDDYYPRLMHGTSEAFQRVFVHGLNGDDMSGRSVFGELFSYEFHTRPTLRAIEGHTFMIGLDTDRNPAAIIMQREMTGRLRVLKEVFVEGVGLEKFFTGHLTPTMFERFHGSAYVVADPSCVKRDSIGEESQLMAINRLGYEVSLAPTNDLDPRLRAVDTLLTLQMGGEAAVLISQEGCPTLIRALQSEYRYPRSRAGELNPKPMKTHPFSDLVDAFGYGAMGFQTMRMGKPIRMVGARNYGGTVPKAPASVSKLAWT